MWYSDSIMITSTDTDMQKHKALYREKVDTIFYYIISYYKKIDINFEEASHSLEITANSLQTTRFSEQDLITIYKKLGVLYRSTSNFEKSTKFYLRSMKIQEKTLPPSHASKANI